MTILAIDPGLKGAFVLLDKAGEFKHWEMPLKDGAVDFDGVHEILHDVQTKCGRNLHIYLERAVSFGMGTKSAFNYGRGFGFIEIAIFLTEIPFTLVEPGKWSKVMHAGIAKDLKAKSKSLIAVQRLYPKLMKHLPKNRNGKAHDGVIDALLIAGYGLKQGTVEEDFY